MFILLLSIGCKVYPFLCPTISFSNFTCSFFSSLLSALSSFFSSSPPPPGIDGIEGIIIFSIIILRLGFYQSERLEIEQKKNAWMKILAGVFWLISPDLIRARNGILKKEDFRVEDILMIGNVSRRKLIIPWVVAEAGESLLNR